MKKLLLVMLASVLALGFMGCSDTLVTGDEVDYFLQGIYSNSAAATVAGSAAGIAMIDTGTPAMKFVITANQITLFMTDGSVNTYEIVQESSAYMTPAKFEDAIVGIFDDIWAAADYVTVTASIATLPGNASAEAQYIDFIDEIAALMGLSEAFREEFLYPDVDPVGDALLNLLGEFDAQGGGINTTRERVAFAEFTLIDKITAAELVTYNMGFALDGTNFGSGTLYVFDYEIDEDENWRDWSFLPKGTFDKENEF